MTSSLFSLWLNGVNQDLITKKWKLQRKPPLPLFQQFSLTYRMIKCIAQLQERTLYSLNVLTLILTAAADFFTDTLL